MFNYSETKDAVRKLQKNEQNIGKDVLRQKYGKPYKQLLADIGYGTGKMIAAVCAGTIDTALEHKDGIPDQLWKKLMDDVRRIRDEEDRAGTFDRIRRAVFEDYDLDKAIDIAFQRFGIRIKYEALPPVWLYFCRQLPDGRFRNDMTGMTWMPSSEDGPGFWEKRTEDGTHEYSFRLPPTWAEIAKEYEEEKARLWEE